MQPNFQHIPLHQLVLSSTTAQKERRAHFDKAALKELAESIRTVGVLQPIVARPLLVPETPGLTTFEIVAGERRFMAADIAKLETVPVNVRELSDEQVLEIQLVENLQRADVHPMAEAEGYEALRKMGRPAEEIADKVGKSKAYVYARMKLLDLVKPARKAYYDGRLNASTALYVARLPSSLQEQAMKETTTSRWSDEPMSARDAQRHLQENYMLRLGDAGFKPDDATLVPAAGPCGTCPKRTGNQPELFGDVKGADVCTDKVCFTSKVRAHGERLIAEAKKSGQRVIVGEAAVKKIAPWGTHSSLQDHVRLTDTSYDHGSKKYAEVLGKDYVPTLLQDPATGAVIKLAPMRDIPRPKQEASTTSRSSGMKSHAAEKAKRDFEEKYRKALLWRVYEAAPETPSRDLLIKACNAAAYDCDHDDALTVVRACGLPFGEKSNLYDEKAFTKLTDGQLARLALVLMLFADLPSGGYGEAKSLERAAGAMKIDHKKLRADMKAAEKAATKTKASTNKKTPKK